MAVYTLSNTFRVSEITPLGDSQALNVSTGQYQINSSATVLSPQIKDDDNVLEDSVNSSTTNQTADTTMQVLEQGFDGMSAGTYAFSRVTYEVRVTDPDGQIYDMEAIQLRFSGGGTYVSFQGDVPAGSTFDVKSVISSGNTNYADLDASSQTNEIYEYNQVLDQTSAQELINNFSSGSLNSVEVGLENVSSIYVIDNDTVIQDNIDASTQSLDQNIQNLDQAFNGHPLGAYVYSRGYYNVVDTQTGQTGRLYQLRIDNDWDGLSVPDANGTYYALSNEISVTSLSTLRITSGLQPVGDVDHSKLYISICFVNGTTIETDRGEIKVEELRIGDRVLTKDNGHQRIRWIGSSEISVEQLRQNPNLRPVHISAGALGPKIPSNDLLVSQQHRLLIHSSVTHKMFDADEVLVAAKHLTSLLGIKILEDEEPFKYFHVLLDNHEVIYANGAETESLFLGDQALKSVSPEYREEILAIFPEFRNGLKKDNISRLEIPRKRAERMAYRHQKNQIPLADRS